MGYLLAATLPWCDDDLVDLGDAANFCCNFTSQSPIDIPVGDAVCNPAFGPMRLNACYFRKATGKYENSGGHTAKFTPTDGISRTFTGGPVGDAIYELLQFHFHWGRNNMEGSEHAYDGVFFPLEIHLVHINTIYNGDVNAALENADGLSVMGIMFELNSRADALFFKELNPTMISGVGDSVTLTLDVAELIGAIPDPSNYVSYNGSLTTPTCNEVVTWINFLDPIPLPSSIVSTEVFGSTGSVGDGHFVRYSRKSVTLGGFNAKFQFGHCQNVRYSRKFVISESGTSENLCTSKSLVINYSKVSI